jgi:N6-L-threonylcarbamoyladenine synthase
VVRILAIETSCDETAAAVVDDGRTVRSSVVASQADLHARFGGVVPEIASRAHVELIDDVIEQALVEAGTTLIEIDAVAAVHGPGLAGALLVGVSAAKAIALAMEIPYVGRASPRGARVCGDARRPRARTTDDHARRLRRSHAADRDGRHGSTACSADRRRCRGGSLRQSRAVPRPRLSRRPAIDRIAHDGDADAIAFPRPMLDDGTTSRSRV